MTTGGKDALAVLHRILHAHPSLVVDTSYMAELVREDIAAVRRSVDAIPKPWPEWGGGWSGQVEAALIDAVLSIRARYGSSLHHGSAGSGQPLLELV